jgi:hypothetical protein
MKQFWLPWKNSLSDRFASSLRLIELREAQRRRFWHDIMSLDEPWFHFITTDERIWLPQDTPPLKENG